MMSRFSASIPLVLFLVLGAVFSIPSKADDIFETAARAAFLIDLETDQILYEKNADQPIPPASMSKLMTAYMVLEQLEDGRLKMDDTLPISEKAWKKGGSKMFVEVDKRALQSRTCCAAVIVQSGNDACIVLAEAIAGSEENVCS